MRYYPIVINKFNIYDIFHNSLNNIVVITPYNKTYLDIKYKKKKLEIFVCPHKRAIIYVLKDEIKYNKIIELNIEDETITTEVNKYPDFKNVIIMSTLVRNEDDYIKQWIIFHKNIGIDRFIIYDNKGDKTVSSDLQKTQSSLECVLQEFINDGTVILIKWAFSYGRNAQPTQQNHSLWSFKSCKYIGMFDIDEYVNIQTNHININSFFDNLILTNDINTDNIGSFRLLNKFFYNPNDLPTNDYNFLQIYNCDKIKFSGNEKGFAIPKNVSVYCVHMITLGKPMYTVPHKMLYFNHYYFLNKSHRGKTKTDLIDTSIKRHTNFITWEK